MSIRSALTMTELPRPSRLTEDEVIVARHVGPRFVAVLWLSLDDEGTIVQRISVVRHEDRGRFEDLAPVVDGTSDWSLPVDFLDGTREIVCSGLMVSWRDDGTEIAYVSGVRTRDVVAVCDASGARTEVRSADAPMGPFVIPVDPGRDAGRLQALATASDD